MKLYFMKQSALDYMKANIQTLYKNYFQFTTSEWINDLFDYDPFDVFDVVDDFELADLEQAPGVIDFQNCKILYSKLKFLSDSQASDERLWAGLCNKNFYEYMRSRWQYAKRHLKKTSDDSSAILMRYFFKSSGRSGVFRNTLARCWWTGRLTYSDKYANHWELLDAIGSEDIISKISDIFYSNTYSSNMDIVEGFCQGLKYYRDRGIYISNRDHIRPTAQYLNAVGGGVLLDVFSADEIKNFVVRRLSVLVKGADLGVEFEFAEDQDALIDINADNESIDAQEVNEDYIDYLESLETVDSTDDYSILGEIKTVEYGSKVLMKRTPEDTSYLIEMPLASGTLNKMQSDILGKPVGTVWPFQGDYKGSTYTIIDIRR